MSWLKSVASSEEVFDEDVDDISLQNKEWKYNMEKRVKVREQSFMNVEPPTALTKIVLYSQIVFFFISILFECK